MLLAHSVHAAAWEPTEGQLQRLLRGEILVDGALDAGAAAGRARAAVWIKAPPALVFAWMTDCTRALQFVPKLTTCRVVATAADQSYQDIEHVVDYSWYLPRTRYVFRAEYVPARSVQFRTLSGDLTVNEGRWELTPLPDPARTLVTYDVRIKPKIYVPRWLVRRSLSQDLPELLAALRRVTEAAAQPPAP